MFYHPAVWWISGVIRAERENCCDDLVVATRATRTPYAVALAALEQSRSTAVRSRARRHRRKSRETHSPPARSTGDGRALRHCPVLSAAILTITAAALTGGVADQAGRSVRAAVSACRACRAACGQAARTGAAKPVRPARARRRSNRPTASGSPRTSPTSSRTPSGRAFKALQTDEEREHFIEQFWLRRDPTPGTPENEFKEEHYRRIAYANERFDAAGLRRLEDRPRPHLHHLRSARREGIASRRRIRQPVPV